MRVIAALALLASLAGCVTPVARLPAQSNLSDGFWASPPGCVVVLPAGAQGEVAARMAERAFAERLFGRVGRVIGPDQRDAETRHLALDLTHGGDRARFAGLAGCSHGARLALAGGRHWAVIWAEATLDLEATLIELESGEAVWTARHRTSRGNGGLPLSPIGLALAVGTAGSFAADTDLIPSVLDDGLRALVATLPDTRGYLASRNSMVSPLSSRK